MGITSEHLFMIPESPMIVQGHKNPPNPSTEEKWTQRSYLQLIPAGKAKAVFSDGMTLDTSTIHKDRAHVQD